MAELDAGRLAEAMAVQGLTDGDSLPLFDVAEQIVAEYARTASASAEPPLIVVPSLDQVDQAIHSVEYSQQTHRRWAAYRRHGGKDGPEAGDLAAHEGFIDRYAQVLAVLRAFRPLVAPTSVGGTDG